MARVHFVKKARKDNKAAGVKKGESYYWWANRMPGRAFGVKRYSKTPPRPSQVAAPGSFRSCAAALQERLDDLTTEMSASDIKTELDDIALEARGLAEEQQEKFDNMPEGLQQGDTGQLLEERREALENWAEELELVGEDEDDLEGMIETAQAASLDV
jgi:hypothetical protein